MAKTHNHQEKYSTFDWVPWMRLSAMVPDLGVGVAEMSPDADFISAPGVGCSATAARGDSFRSLTYNGRHGASCLCLSSLLISIWQLSLSMASETAADVIGENASRNHVPADLKYSFPYRREFTVKKLSTNVIYCKKVICTGNGSSLCSCSNY